MTAISLAIPLLWMAPRVPAPAQDAPHNVNCYECHLNHDQLGDQFASLAGNANLCLSCHSSGGSASRKKFADSDQAVPWPGAGTNTIGKGRSHRWDANPAGRVESLSGAPAGALLPAGHYTGVYASSFTVTIVAAGEAGSARFNWAADAPWSGGATNILTGTRVLVSTDAEGYSSYRYVPAAIQDGISLSFLNARPSPSLRVGDSWRVFLRPDLNAPVNEELLRILDAGVSSCSTCHDQHYQDNEPFDPAAPPLNFANNSGRHFMRLNNQSDQLCAECHSSRFVTNAAFGSHPVGINVLSNALLSAPATLPLGKADGKMWCSTCHQVHNSPSADGNLLRGAEQSALCSECHKSVDVAGPARHLMPLDGLLWPGGQYGSLFPADTDPSHRGNCGTCHRVHGWPDAANSTNVYPSLLVDREENLCLTCHDGSPAEKNLKAEFAKTYKHPVSTAGRHRPDETSSASYGTANRHSECADCHNVHTLGNDAFAPSAPAASQTLKGVARVAVTNISATQVAYTFRPASDPTPVKEYELCFTCHSSWTTRPAGQGDLAAEFNDKNASFHPVEAPGKNSNINPNAFVNGWNASRLMTCTDCHSSDNATIRGPHGSSYPYILKKATSASPARRSTAMPSTEICFDCHRYDTYANNSASSTLKNYSRFAGGNGHGYHVGSQRYSCFNCHDSHGAQNQPSLLVIGRSPGIETYSRTATGGSCNPTCHGNENYTVAYPR